MSATRGKSALAAIERDQEISGLLGAAVDEGGQEAGAREVPLRDLLGDQVLDALLDRSKDDRGGLRLTGEGSMLGELVKAVLERALEAELSAHLGYGNDLADHQDRLARSHPWRDQVLPELSRMLTGTPQRLRLAPTPRSLLR